MFRARESLHLGRLRSGGSSRQGEPHPPGLEPSAALRSSCSRLNQLQSADEAADWIHANLAAKNTLIAADCDRVELVSATDSQRMRPLRLARQPQSTPAAGIASPVEEPFLAPTDDTAPAAIMLPSGPGARRRRIALKPIRYATRSTVRL